jgi:hypothetical protein
MRDPQRGVALSIFSMRRDETSPGLTRASPHGPVLKSALRDAQASLRSRFPEAAAARGSWQPAVAQRGAIKSR